jgi:hypothetical protein
MVSERNPSPVLSAVCLALHSARNTCRTRSLCFEPRFGGRVVVRAMPLAPDDSAACIDGADELHVPVPEACTFDDEAPVSERSDLVVRPVAIDDLDGSDAPIRNPHDRRHREIEFHSLRSALGGVVSDIRQLEGEDVTASEWPHP